jgi:methionine synthase II (cobalamin-independent)
MGEPLIENLSNRSDPGHPLPGSPESARPDASDMTQPSSPSTPWRAGLATGIGSIPGTDPAEAARLVAGELPDFLHLAELPDRGPGADMLGRALALCVDMPAEVTPFGWRLARRTGGDIRRARDFLSWDMDAAEQHYAGAEWVKVQAAGPWTLAAQVETPQGNRAVTDAGAVRDLAESLAEGLAAHVADLAKRLPGTRFVVQIDEPSLPSVRAGNLPTASGLGAVRAIAAAEAATLLSGLVNAVGDRPTVVHCCHPDVPLALLRGAGFDALSLDLSSGVTLPSATLDQIGEAVEDGTVLFAGLVPTREPAPRIDFHAAAAPLLDLWHRLGLPDRRLEQVIVTPICGLAGVSPEWTRNALALARDAARLLADRALG